MAKKTCHDCRAEIGEFHGPNCDWEQCPFCRGQLLTCGCSYRHLRLNPRQEPTRSKGLNEEQEKMWGKILGEKGRIPYGDENYAG
jgi:hypothetical protein